MLPFELTKDTPYLALSGELWSVFCEYFNINWSCYKGFLLYVSIGAGSGLAPHRQQTITWTNTKNHIINIAEEIHVHILWDVLPLQCVSSGVTSLSPKPIKLWYCCTVLLLRSCTTGALLVAAAKGETFLGKILYLLPAELFWRKINWWLGARLLYLQCIRNGGTAVLH